jgi:hypothetical protein
LTDARDFERHPDLLELITCWHRDPTIRPAFLEIMTRLSTMHADMSGDITSRNSSSGTSGGARLKFEVAIAFTDITMVLRGAAGPIGRRHSSSTRGRPRSGRHHWVIPYDGAAGVDVSTAATDHNLNVVQGPASSQGVHVGQPKVVRDRRVEYVGLR